MYRSLLVPLDGSPPAEQALPVALSIARRTGAALNLVSVQVPFPQIYGEDMARLETRWRPTPGRNPAPIPTGWFNASPRLHTLPRPPHCSKGRSPLPSAGRQRRPGRIWW
jgi:nucleotide-binding universal stress UspA family protein